MIHPNVFVFLIFLISCWFVAVSLVAEKTNVGVAVFVADNTSMCGFGSEGTAALLSACSLVRCCSHQFVFPCLEVLPKVEHSSTSCDQLHGPPRT